MGAADVGANHQRDRIWIVAHTKSIGDRRELRGLHRSDETQWKPQKHGQDATTEFNDGCKDVANTNSTHGEGNQCTERGEQKRAFYGKSSWWETEPNVGRVADGVAARVDRLKAIGNGQVPVCAATAWKILLGEMN